MTKIGVRVPDGPLLLGMPPPIRLRPQGKVGQIDCDCGCRRKEQGGGKKGSRLQK